MAILENNREEYYAHLNAITKNNDWQHWIEFFLRAIIYQAEKNTKKAKEVLALYDKMKDRFILHDITDVFMEKYASRKILEQGISRQEIYKEQNFPYEIINHTIY